MTGKRDHHEASSSDSDAHSSNSPPANKKRRISSVGEIKQRERYNLSTFTAYLSSFNDLLTRDIPNPTENEEASKFHQDKVICKLTTCLSKEKEEQLFNIDSELNRLTQQFMLKLSIDKLKEYCNEFHSFQLQPLSNTANSYRQSPLESHIDEKLDKGRLVCLTWLLMRNDSNLLRNNALFKKEVIKNGLLSNAEAVLYLIRFCIHYHLDQSLEFILYRIDTNLLRQLFLNDENEFEGFSYTVNGGEEQHFINLIDIMLHLEGWQSNMAIRVFIDLPVVLNGTKIRNQDFIVDTDEAINQDIRVLANDPNNQGHHDDLTAQERRNTLLELQPDVSDMSDDSYDSKEDDDIEPLRSCYSR